MGDSEQSVGQHHHPPDEAEGRASVSPPSKAALPPTEPFWARVRRHKVVEWTLAYIAFGYALLHGVQMLRETFEWPLLVPRLTVIGLVAGAPIAMTLAWYHGHRARHRVSGQELSILIVLLLIAGSVLWWVSRNSHERASSTDSPPTASNAPARAAAAFSPPPHSIAVLPFVSLSGDKEQEYFSDGLTEELLNSLAEIEGLQVAARTSSFSFREHPDVATVAHKLNVGAVLQGSVRRSGDTVRVTAQLINAVTGFHLWSRSYDRDLGDVLKLQTEIATAVATALEVTLLADVSAKIELGGTRNPGAFDAYVRGLKASQSMKDPRDIPAAVQAYTEAIRLDPNYALAFARRSLALSVYSADEATGAAFREGFDQAEADARRAIALAPELAQAHLALANVFKNKLLDFSRARSEYERAMALAPGNAEVLRLTGGFAAAMGHFDAGIAAARRSLALDPLDQESHFTLGMALYVARRYPEAAAAFSEAVNLNPDFTPAYVLRGLAFYLHGDLESGRASCESKPQYWFSQWCLAIVYEKLGRHADAAAGLAKVNAAQTERAAYHYATIYAQWGNRRTALDWLDTALRARNSALEYLKTDALLDPIRNESRFQAIERELKFPD